MVRISFEGDAETVISEMRSLLGQCAARVQEAQCSQEPYDPIANPGYFAPEEVATAVQELVDSGELDKPDVTYKGEATAEPTTAEPEPAPEPEVTKAPEPPPSVDKHTQLKAILLKKLADDKTTNKDVIKWLKDTYGVDKAKDVPTDKLDEAIETAKAFGE